MSTDTGHRGWHEDPGSLLEAPLVGLERRRTAVAIAYLLTVVAMFGVSYAGSTVTIDGAHLDTLTKQFDTLRTILIVVATATMAIVPLVYAVWNGGPALSFAFPLVPELLSEVIAGGYVLDLDAAIALTVGATASALALLAIDVRRRGVIRPWRSRAPDARSLWFVTIVVLVAAVGILRFVTTAPTHILEWYAPFGALWLVTAAIVPSYWYALRRTAASTTRDRVNA